MSDVRLEIRWPNGEAITRKIGEGRDPERVLFYELLYSEPDTRVALQVKTAEGWADAEVGHRE